MSFVRHNSQSQSVERKSKLIPVTTSLRVNMFYVVLLITGFSIAGFANDAEECGCPPLFGLDYGLDDRKHGEYDGPLWNFNATVDNIVRGYVKQTDYGSTILEKMGDLITVGTRVRSGGSENYLRSWLYMVRSLVYTQ